jgi:hypothetical protein
MLLLGRCNEIKLRRHLETR